MEKGRGPIGDMLPGDTLTPREQEVLTLLADGLTDREIGEQLGIRPRTVKSHTAIIYQKLGVSSRLHAALWVWRQRKADAEVEAEHVRQAYANMRPEFRALKYFMDRAAKLIEELGAEK